MATVDIDPHLRRPLVLTRRGEMAVQGLAMLACAAIAIPAGNVAAQKISNFFNVLKGMETTSKVSGEKATERCVSILVGREVDLVPDPLGPGLQHPRSVFDQQRACELNGNDPSQARANMIHVALAPVR